MTEPRQIVVKRWVCGGNGCTRSFSRRDAIEAHMETCWRVPENRACLSCSHFEMRTCCDTPSFGCGCRGERDWLCGAGIHVEPGKPVIQCESWGACPTSSVL